MALRHIIILAMATMSATPTTAAPYSDIRRIPAVMAVTDKLRPLCVKQRRTANFTADFFFSVDADGHSGDDDIFLTGPGSSA